MEKEDKLKALDAALAQIEKQFGKGAVMKLGDPATQMNVETIPTGSLSLDIALGLGGIPKGRIVEIYGPESSGKTTVTLHMIAEVQRRGGIAGFIDAEHALDPAYAKNIGVDIDNLYISQPDNGEQALEITETMVGVMFGNPETTTGGRALKFYSTIRLDVRRIESLKQAGEVVGNRTRVKVVKNKIAPPFKEAEFDIMFGEGISKVGDILDLAADINIVNKSGAWFAYEGNKIGQGRENAKNFLKENTKICDEIEKKVRAYYKLDEKKEADAADGKEEPVKEAAGAKAAKDSREVKAAAGSAVKAVQAEQK